MALSSGALPGLILAYCLLPNWKGWLVGIIIGLLWANAFECIRRQPLFPGHTLGRLYLSGFDAYYVGLLFYSLASTACSYLFFKSGYIPRGLAAFGVKKGATNRRHRLVARMITSKRAFSALNFLLETVGRYISGMPDEAMANFLSLPG